MKHRRRSIIPVASSNGYDTVGAKMLRKAAMVALATSAACSSPKVESKAACLVKPAPWEGLRYLMMHEIVYVSSAEEYRNVLLAWGPQALF